MDILSMWEVGRKTMKASMWVGGICDTGGCSKIALIFWWNRIQGYELKTQGCRYWEFKEKE